MSKIDFLSLDGRSLRTFLMVLDEMSISKAAERLGVTQSAVSHLLDKLRLAFGDPLFVRAGRGIAPTERARNLREPVQAVLDGLKGLTDERVFDPLVGELDFTVAANDFQRDLIFPDLLRTFRTERVDVRFRFLPSGIPAVGLLRQARCQLIVTPFPPNGADIYHSRLFVDHVICFYDDDLRDAPRSLKAFGQADRLDVQFEEDESASKALDNVPGLVLRPPRVLVPNFSDLATFLKGTDLIVTQLSMMGKVNLRGFSSAPLPFSTPSVPMYMAWHRRDHRDPANKWLRERIKAFIAQLLPDQPIDCGPGKRSAKTKTGVCGSGATAKER
jgi:DNA-binding transcriptional LysR family regulator